VLTYFKKCENKLYFPNLSPNLFTSPFLGRYLKMYLVVINHSSVSDETHTTSAFIELYTFLRHKIEIYFHDFFQPGKIHISYTTKRLLPHNMYALTSRGLVTVKVNKTIVTRVSLNHRTHYYCLCLFVFFYTGKRKNGNVLGR